MTLVTTESQTDAGLESLLTATNIEEVALAAGHLASLGSEVYGATIEAYLDRLNTEPVTDRTLVDYAENLHEIAQCADDIDLRKQSSGRFAGLIILENEAARSFHTDGDYYTADLVAYDLNFNKSLTSQELQSRVSAILDDLRVQTKTPEDPNKIATPSATELYSQLVVPESSGAEQATLIEVVRNNVLKINGKFIKLTKHQLFIMNVLLLSQDRHLSAADFHDLGFGMGLKPTSARSLFSVEKQKLVQEVCTIAPELLVTEIEGRRYRTILMSPANVIDRRSENVDVPQLVLSSKGPGRRQRTTASMPGNTDLFDGDIDEREIYSSDVDDLIKLYFGEIAEHKLLTKEEEITLAKKVQLGQKAKVKLGQVIDDPERTSELQLLINEGKAAKDRMVVANLRLSVWIAKKYAYQTKHLKLLDLIQEGNTGLKRAVDKFDPERGFKFSTYAGFWVRQRITRAISNQDSLIRTPDDVSNDVRRTFAIANRLEEELQRKPSYAEISAASKGKLSIKSVKQALEAEAIQPYSLDKELSKDSERDLKEVLPDEIGADRQLAELVAQANARQLDIFLEASDLTLREKYAISLRYGANVYHLHGTKYSTPTGTAVYDDLIKEAIKKQGLTFTRIGAELKVTGEYARRLTSGAIAKLARTEPPDYNLPE